MKEPITGGKAVFCWFTFFLGIAAIVALIVVGLKTIEFAEACGSTPIDRCYRESR